MIAVDLDANTVTRNGETFKVYGQHAEILHVLSSGAVVTHDEMTAAIHGVNEPEWSQSSMKVQITLLRRILAPRGLTIEAVWGVGWRLYETGQDENIPGEAGDGVVLHPVLNRARINGHVLRLQPIQARILRQLAGTPLADRATLIARAWEGQRRPRHVDNALHAQICTLRKRLRPYGVAIQNRHGSGYVLTNERGGAA